jgi:hypothetical protein
MGLVNWGVVNHDGMLKVGVFVKYVGKTHVQTCACTKRWKEILKCNI